MLSAREYVSHALPLTFTHQPPLYIPCTSSPHTGQVELMAFLKNETLAEIRARTIKWVDDVSRSTPLPSARI
jgi:hypothetical protein